MFDRLTPFQRHSLLLAIAGALGVLGDSLHLLDLPPSLAPLAAAALTAAIAYLTPLTRQYGIGELQAQQAENTLPEDPWTEGDDVIVADDVVDEVDVIDAEDPERGV